MKNPYLSLASRAKKDKVREGKYDACSNLTNVSLLQTRLVYTLDEARRTEQIKYKTHSFLSNFQEEKTKKTKEETKDDAVRCESVRACTCVNACVRECAKMLNVPSFLSTI